MEQEQEKPSARWLMALMPLAAAALCVGWATFWFVCDDAYIAFRYISNRHAGWGYVWNPPPFVPVEGYTSFLWVVLCDLIWTVTGVIPPIASTCLGLLFAQGTLAVTAWMAWHVRLPTAWERWRPALLALVLVGVLVNKSFLVWTSSGLETPLFVFLHVSFVAWATMAPRGRGWVVLGATLGALLVLTRPDGMLYLAGAPVIVAAAWLAGRPLRRFDLWAVVPLSAVVAHALWRFRTYGDWVPNTYYAKVAEPWLAGGAGQLWMYVLEHAWFLWVPVLVVAIVRQRDALRRWGSWVQAGPTLVVAGLLCAHVLYYVLKVGGDHFEFRIYAHLPPLIFVGTLPLLAAVTTRPARGAVLLAVLIPWTMLIPWTDWSYARTRVTPDQIKKLHIALADKLPWVLSPWIAEHDRQEAYCVKHVVATNHQVHKMFRIHTAARYRPRAEMEETFPRNVWRAGATGKKAMPIVPLSSVGVAAWRLPHVAIIDRFGLNDKVIARNYPDDPTRYRFAAHDRFPPPGYIECFQPSVVVLDRFEIKGREAVFTHDDIRRCEADWLAKITAERSPGQFASPEELARRAAEAAKAADKDKAKEKERDKKKAERRKAEAEVLAEAPGLSPAALPVLP